MDFHALFEETFGKSSYVLESRVDLEPEPIENGGDIMKSYGVFVYLFRDLPQLN